MKATVVYESMFGNTEAVARAIGEGLNEYGDVTVSNVDDLAAGQIVDADLLVVGGPTHAFSLSRKSTRQQAAQQAKGELVTRQGGLREWLAGLPRGTSSAAAFDTRVAKPRWLPHRAAHAAAKRLRATGRNILAQPEGFHVTGTTGPMLDGELDRARRWGTTLGANLMARTG